MLDPNTDFDFAPTSRGADRDLVLDRAGAALDHLAIRLGDGDGDVSPSELGDLARSLKEDRVTVERPQIYRLRRRLPDRGQDDVPLDSDDLLRDARFYWVHLPVTLWAPVGWAFNRLTAAVAFSSDAGDGPGAVTTRVLPDPQIATYLKIGAAARLSFDADLQLSVDVPATAATALLGIPADAGAGAAVKAAAAIEAGPFEYRLTAPKVAVKGVGGAQTRWRLDGAEYLSGADPGLRVVLKVPPGVQQLQVAVVAEARRYFNFLDGRLQEKVTAIPKAIANFFHNGTPISHEGRWDLTAEL